MIDPTRTYHTMRLLKFTDLTLGRCRRADTETMKRQPTLILIAIVTAGLLLCVGVPLTVAFPEPSIVSKAWQYDFSYEAPRPIAVTELGGRVRWYWYMTYKVTNNTGEERLFVPEVTLFTDTGDIFPSGKDVPAGVFNAIKEQVGNPLLENPAEIIGRLLQGPDYAKEGAAIWPAFDEDVDEVTVYISGLSGETQAIAHPITGKRVVLRKTLMISYDQPGTSSNIQDQPMVKKDEQWIMR